MNDLFVRIRFLLPSLPRAEKAIASALLENPEAITHLTLAEIARESGSSEASIIRFCKRMGYDGYSSMKEDFIRALAEGMEIHSEDIKVSDDMKTILKKVYQSNVQMMTAGNLTSEDVALAVSYEGRSRNVVEAMKIAKERGAVTISITKMNKSPLLRYTDISLFTAVNDLTVGRDKVTRRVSDQFILDALYLGYTTKINKGYKKQLQKIQTVIDCNKI